MGAAEERSSARALAAGGERHPGSLGKRHPSRGGGGRRVLSGLLFASPQLQWRRVEFMPETTGCPERAKEGNLCLPSPCDGNPRGFKTTRGDGSFAWCSDLRVFRRAFAWPSRWYRERQVFRCSCRRKSVMGVWRRKRARGQLGRRRVACTRGDLSRKGGPLCEQKRVAALVWQGYMGSIGFRP